MGSPPSTVTAAYRSLFRTGLRAIQFSSPARYALKSTMRRSFREGSVSDFDSVRIQNTIVFLENATKTRGIEHKVLRNILFYRWWEHDEQAKRKYVRTRSSREREADSAYLEQAKPQLPQYNALLRQRYQSI